MKLFSLLALLVLTISIGATCQDLPKGTKLMGGSFEVRGVMPDEGPNTFAIDLRPAIALFVSNNFAIGPGLNLAYSNTSDIDTRSFKFGLSPLVRHYFGEGNKKIFGQGTIGYNWTEETSGGVTTSNNFVSGGVGIGIAIFPAPPIGLDMSLNYVISPLYVDGLHVGNISPFFLFVSNSKCETRYFRNFS